MDIKRLDLPPLLRTVQELLGHKGVSTTMIYYAQTVVMRSEVP